MKRAVKQLVMREGRYKVVYEEGMGYAVFRLGRFFWQQISCWYTYKGNAVKLCRKKAFEDECKDM